MATLTTLRLRAFSISGPLYLVFFCCVFSVSLSFGQEVGPDLLLNPSLKGGEQTIPEYAGLQNPLDLVSRTSSDPLCSCVSNLLVFPNPGSEKLNLKTKLKSGFQYLIFNGLGKKMAQINNAESEESLDTSKWPSGLYYVWVLETGKKICLVKILILSGSTLMNRILTRLFSGK